jgi:hypothetical protein
VTQFLNGIWLRHHTAENNWPQSELSERHSEPKAEMAFAAAYWLNPSLSLHDANATHDLRRSHETRQENS